MELDQCGGGILERQRGAAHEAVGVGAVGLNQGIVEGSRQPGAELGRRPVGHWNRERQGVDLDTLPVHCPDAAIEVPVRRVERGAGAGDPAHADQGAPRRPVDPAPVRPALELDEPEKAFGKEVRVDVDAVGPGHVADCTAPAPAAR